MLKIGRSEWLMRFPSALTGFMTIPLMWRIGYALKRPNLGLLAAALIALAPLHIWYSRDARMYALAMLFWTASIYFYIQLLQRDNLLDLLGLVLTTTGGLYTAYPTLALWVGQIALFYLLWQLTGKKIGRLLRWFLAQLAIGALFYGWWPFLQEQLNRPLVFNWLNLFESILGPQTAQRLDQWLAQNGLTTTLAGTLQLALMGALLFIIVSFLFSLLIIRRPTIINLIKRADFALAILIVLVFLALTIAGAIPRGLSLRRQLLVFWLPLVILAAWALLRLRDKWTLGAVILLSLVLSLYTVFSPPYEDWRSTVAAISENSQPGDLILLTPAWSKMAFDYYYQGDLLYIGTNANLAQRELNTLVEARHVWLVVNRHPSIAGETEVTENWFAQNGVLINSYTYPQFLNIYEMEFSDP
jgi:4-amino-4-deoxy-L-arabinose transferase-like glycosyltransferase